MSEVVPEGWENLTVQDAFELGRGRVISKEEIRDNAGKYPVYSSQSTNNGKMGSINTYDFDGEYVTWTTDGAYAGTVFYRNGKFSCTNVCGTVRDKNSHQVDMKFVSEYLSTVAKNHVSYVGNPKLMNGIFGEIKFLSPPLPEQKKIASILTSVDEVIEKTQSQIDKLQDLKKGTMNELLTKGIGHTEFKDSELGRIPKSWEVRTLGEVVNNNRPITYGIVQAGRHIEGGIPYIRVSDMKSGFLSPKNMLRTSSEIALNFGRSRVESGDIVYALRGDVGSVLRVPLELEGANLTQGTALISQSKHIDTEFLLWNMRSEIVKKQTNDLAKGSTFVEMTLGNLKGIKLVVPAETEQQEIVRVLESIQKKEWTTSQKLSQTQSLKKSLMQDLLTGKVRVSVN